VEVHIEQDLFLLCASGSVVVGLDANKGDLKFSFKGHKDIVTAIYYNPLHASKVISSSIDGVIIIWDLYTRAETVRYDVGIPVQQFLYPEFTQYEVTEKTDLYLVVNKTTNPEDIKNTNDPDGPDRYKMVVFDTEKKKIRKNFCAVSNKTNCMHLAKFAGAEFVLAASKRKLAIVFPETRRGFKSVCSIEHNLTCVSSNSNKDFIITGHMNGQILIWHDVVSWIGNEAKRVMDDASRELLTASTPPACTVLHWHAHNVSSLASNFDGSLIYSGGDEGVLVVWQTTSGAKAFIPHLGAAISHITSSASQASAYVTTNSNTVRAVNTASLLESWVIQSLCIGPFLDHALPSDRKARCQIVCDPNSDAIVCNGYPGYLQFYDPINSNVSAVHEVVHYNRVTRTENYTRLYFPCVSFFKFHSYIFRDHVRHVLATVDVRRGEDYARDVNLKFWEWSDTSKCFRLMTHIPRPHGEHRITSVAFNPSSTSLACATTAVDGSVKYWRSGKQGDHHWICVYSFTYRSVRADACSFSSDGSVFAVAHGNVVSLWEPNSLVMRASFVLPSSDQVKFTGFIEPNNSFAGSGQAYLVVGSKHCLTVFDLLTMNRLWSFNGRLSGFSIATSDAVTMQNVGRKEVDAESSGCRDRSAFGWIAVCNAKPRSNKDEPGQDGKASGDAVLMEEEGDSDDEDMMTDSDDSNCVCEVCSPIIIPLH
jgi:NET1-associated nuclear protein 1 (U3 small nucleolar RNA-associated protein 17)